MIVQTRVRDGRYGIPKGLTVVRRITAARSAAIGFGPMSGSSTLLTLDAAVAGAMGGDLELMADVREYQVHEVTSPPLSLRQAAYFQSSGFSSGANALDFFGTLAEALPLAGRRLLLQPSEGEPLELTCTSEPDDLVLPAGADADEPRMWTLSFDRPPSPLTRADFDETEPTVTVYGNLADATQGKDERGVSLGNGDARARFQTFKLPKAPLTYLPAPGSTPPRAPELEVRVAGRLWARVDSFFGRGPAEEIYLVREDADGSSYVQFGDGETGARLPSGVKNVTARYRSGSGAFGPAKAKSTPTAGTRIEGLDRVQLPGIVTGGAEPESADGAREAAPGKVQGLGRLVSLRDFETEVLGIGGVTSAVAAWGLYDGSPTLLLRVLLQAGREAEFESVRSTHPGVRALPRRRPLRGAGGAGVPPLRLPRSLLRVRPAPGARRGGGRRSERPSASPATTRRRARGCSGCGAGDWGSGSTPAAWRPWCSRWRASPGAARLRWGRSPPERRTRRNSPFRPRRARWRRSSSRARASCSSSSPTT